MLEVKKKENSFSTVHVFLKLILLSSPRIPQLGRTSLQGTPPSPVLEVPAHTQQQQFTSIHPQWPPAEQVLPGAHLVSAEEGGESVQCARGRETHWKGGPALKHCHLRLPHAIIRGNPR